MNVELIEAGGLAVALTADGVYRAPSEALDLSAFGVDPAHSAAVNTPLFRAAILAAQAQGRDLFVPLMPAGTSIHINDFLHIDGATGPGIRIFGADKRGCRIVQEAMPQHIFRVSAPGTIIENLDLSMASRDVSAYVSGTRPLILGVADYANHSLIRTTLGADGSTFRHLYLHKTHNGIKIDAWDQVNGVYSAVNVQGLVIDDVLIEDMWCGLLAQSHDDLFARQIRGKAYSKQAGLGSPPHVIYTYGNDADNRFNNNPRIVDCYGLNGTGGAAFALKFTKGGSASGLSARNCEGLLDLIQLQDTIVSDYVAVDDVYPLNDVAAARGSVAIKTSQRVDLVNGAVRVKDGDYSLRALYVEGDNYDVRVRGFRATINPTASRAAQPNDIIRISGRRSALKDATLVNLGASFYAGVQINPTAFDTRVEAIKTVGSIRYPVVASGGAGHRVFADPADLPADLAAGAGAVSVKLQAAAANSKWFDTSQVAAGAVVGPPPYYVNEFAVTDQAGLPSTSDGEGIGKPTILINGGSWVVESGAARNSVAAAGGSQALWDAGTQDGTFRTTIKAIGTGNACVILRTKQPTSPATTLQDYLRLNFLTSGTVGRLQLQSRIAGGTVTAVASAAAVDALVDGDVLEVVELGTSIIVKRNGVTILTSTDPDASTDRTYSGLQGTVTGSNTRWERVEMAAS